MACAGRPVRAEPGRGRGRGDERLHATRGRGGGLCRPSTHDGASTHDGPSTHNGASTHDGAAAWAFPAAAVTWDRPRRPSSRRSEVVQCVCEAAFFLEALGENPLPRPFHCPEAAVLLGSRPLPPPVRLSVRSGVTLPADRLRLCRFPPVSGLVIRGSPG